MVAPIRQRPDVLVLGVGGVQGEAWLTGVLAGLSARTGIDFGEVDHVVGTSAGSIVGARLTSGEALPRPTFPAGDAEWTELDSDGRGASERVLRLAIGLGRAAAAPLAPLALAAGAPGGALARAALLGRVPRPTAELRDLRRSLRGAARFDGRLRVVAVDRARGRRVVFGAPGAPAAEVAAAVTASCAVPWMFAPVRIGGREYVDGGVWSPTNLDVAPGARDTEILCLTPTGHLTDARRSAFGVLRVLGSSATALEAAALRRRGARVTVVAPDREAARAMGEDFMDPSGRERAREAGARQGARLAGG